MELHQWGYAPSFKQAFDELGRDDLVPGRVARHDRTGQLVVHEHGDAFARLPSHLRREPPAVGDWVALDLTDPPTIRAILPRRNALARQAPGRETSAQVIAANVDVLLIVASLDTPVNERRIERYLTLAHGAGIEPTIVLNKADLGDARAASERFEGIPAIATSTRTGEGIAALRARLPPGTTGALVGPSGVGKSSLANALLENESLATGEVRAGDQKGRHTTSARHLVAIPGGGVLVDTPGMRELALLDDERAIDATFGEIAALASLCRFADCAHETEPGCTVRERADPARLEAWRKLRREAESAARRADVARDRAAGRAFGRLSRDAVRAKSDRRK